MEACQLETSVNQRNSLNSSVAERELIWKKNNSKHTWVHSGRDATHKKYRTLEREVIAMLFEARERGWEAKIDQANEDQGQSWKLIREEKLQLHTLRQW